MVHPKKNKREREWVGTREKGSLPEKEEQEGMNSSVQGPIHSSHARERQRGSNGFAEALPIFVEAEVLTRLISAGVFLILEINSEITVKKREI